MKLIHKDPEIISTFCTNATNESMVALATHKEVLELDISSILKQPVWIEEQDSDDESGYGS